MFFLNINLSWYTILTLSSLVLICSIFVAKYIEIFPWNEVEVAWTSYYSFNDRLPRLWGATVPISIIHKLKIADSHFMLVLP